MKYCCILLVLAACSETPEPYPKVVDRRSHKQQLAAAKFVQETRANPVKPQEPAGPCPKPLRIISGSPCLSYCVDKGWARMTTVECAGAVRAAGSPSYREDGGLLLAGLDCTEETSVSRDRALSLLLGTARCR